jgi:hypothetical protein
MRDKHPALLLSKCVLYPGMELNPRNEMIAFNNKNNFERAWVTDRGIKIISAANGSLQGIECIKTPVNEPFSIVHGYDRDFTAREMFEYKYRFNGDFDWDAFKAFKALEMANVRSEFKRLRNPYAISTPSVFVPAELSRRPRRK